jgi:Cft2 family RNA processing exonuclease
MMPAIALAAAVASVAVTADTAGQIPGGAAFFWELAGGFVLYFVR